MWLLRSAAEILQDGKRTTALCVQIESSHSTFFMHIVVIQQRLPITMCPFQCLPYKITTAAALLVWLDNSTCTFSLSFPSVEKKNQQKKNHSNFRARVRGIQMRAPSHCRTVQQSQTSAADVSGCVWVELITASVDSRCPHCRTDQAKLIYIITFKLLDKLNMGCFFFGFPPPRAEITIPPHACVWRNRQM